jgi:hypothetical protein
MLIYISVNSVIRKNRWFNRPFLRQPTIYPFVTLIFQQMKWSYYKEVFKCLTGKEVCSLSKRGLKTCSFRNASVGSDASSKSYAIVDHTYDGKLCSSCCFIWQELNLYISSCGGRCWWSWFKSHYWTL